jgi:hypothetical protein
MTSYPLDAMVTVLPFACRRNGETATIGDLDRQVFLEVPISGLDILEALARGGTVGQVARDYQERHGEPVDIQAFLRDLAAEGFVARPDEIAPPGGSVAATAGAVPGGSPDRPNRPPRFVSHLDWLTPPLARKLFATPVLVVCGLLVAGGIVLIATTPGLMPGPSSLAFPESVALLVWLTFLIAVPTTIIHELAHVAAARAAGVRARIGISHRLYVPVLQTDMTAIWLAPKRQRFLGFLSGPIIDAASASILIGVLWAEQRGWVSFPPTAFLLLRGVTFIYIARILWQTFLFLRTDFYYTLATALNCKSLMSDTENYLQNQFAKLRLARKMDQSGIPRSEMRAVRLFAVLWFLGRFAFIAVLLHITVPVLWFYVQIIIDYLTSPVSRYGGFDFLTAVLLSLSVSVLGLGLWMRSLYRGWRRRRAARRAELAV